MATNTLIAYSTTDGHTRKICLRLKEILEARGHAVALKNIAEDPAMDLGPYDRIVIGASIRYGKHSKNVYDFVDRNRHLLDAKPNVFFSVNLVARKPEKASPDTNPYLQKFLRQSGWQPGHAEVFAGKINYPIYNFTDRKIIQFIMWLTKGPTDPATVAEYTDWEQVERLGGLVSDL